MFASDLGSEFSPSRIRIFSIPDSASASKNWSILTQKLFLSFWKYDPSCSSRILIFYPSRIPDPGVKKAPDPWSGSATLHKISYRWVRVPSVYRYMFGSSGTLIQFQQGQISQYTCASPLPCIRTWGWRWGWRVCRALASSPAPCWWPGGTSVMCRGGGGWGAGRGGGQSALSTPRPWLAQSGSAQTCRTASCREKTKAIACGSSQHTISLCNVFIKEVASCQELCRYGMYWRRIRSL